MASAMVTPLDRNLTLNEALSHGDPIAKYDKSTHMGSSNGAEILDVERGTSLCHFQRGTAAEREDS